MVCHAEQNIHSINDIKKLTPLMQDKAVTLVKKDDERNADNTGCPNAFKKNGPFCGANTGQRL